MAITLADLLKDFGRQGGVIQERPPAPDVQGEDIVVENTPYPKSKYKRGLIGGPLAVGTTGGNILGILGDALLAQAGRGPQYSPRLQQLRTGEAIQDLNADPVRAQQMTAGIDNDLSVDIWNKNADNAVQRRNSEILNQDRDERYRQGINTRGFSLLKASTPETYASMRDQVKKYFASKGVEPDFDIPETFEEAASSTPWNADITPQQQDRLDAQRDYQARLLAQRDRAEEGRNRRTDRTLGVRTSEGAANRGVRVSEGDKNREVRRETSKGGRARPKIRFEVVNGVRKIIKEQ